MIDIYDDRNHFMKISTEFTKDLDIKREEIVTCGNRSVDKNSAGSTPFGHTKLQELAKWHLQIPCMS